MPVAEQPGPNSTSRGVAPNAGARGLALRESMRQSLRNRASQASGGSGCGSADKGPSSNASTADSADSPSSEKKPTATGGASLQMAGRGETLRASMRLLLEAKQKKKVEGSQRDPAICLESGKSVEGSAEASSGTARILEEDVDPWPEMPLSATPHGVQDGRNRAAILRRQGDFTGAARMYAKVLYVARFRCRSPFEGPAIASLWSQRASALIDADDYFEADRVCSACLELAAGWKTPDSFNVEVHALRARARCELGHLRGARADISEAVARHRRVGKADRGTHDDDVDEELQALQQTARDIEERLASIRASSGPEPCLQDRGPQSLDAKVRSSASSRKHREVHIAKLASNAIPMDTGSSAASSSSSLGRQPPAFRKLGVIPKDCSPAGAVPSQGQNHDDATRSNQEFFDKMETEFADICAGDGWDDIRRAQEELLSSNRCRPANEIPADSDYFRVQVPHGYDDRELRASASVGHVAPKLSVSKPSVGSVGLGSTSGNSDQFVPTTRRNLDELRAVEAATRVAMEKEKARRSEGSTEATTASPIRKPEPVLVVTPDDLKGEPEDEAAGLPISGEALAAYTAIREFEALKRENEARLAKWRDRWG